MHTYFTYNTYKDMYSIDKHTYAPLKITIEGIPRHFLPFTCTHHT